MTPPPNHNNSVQYEGLLVVYAMQKAEQLIDH